MPRFDLETAREMAASFSASAGVCCRLLDSQGDTLCQEGNAVDECAYLRGLPGTPPDCGDLHLRGLRLAERFGGRYIYSCASGLTYFAAPILTEGTLSGGLVAGPVLISDLEDCIDDLIEKRSVPACDVRELHSFLASIPQVTTTRLRHLSAQLFASAVCVCDSSYELILSRNGERQQRSIGEYVQALKSEEGTPYPIETEQAMLAAVAQGNKPTATSLLNELLGHIFFLSGNPVTAQTRITELLVLLSRAAVDGGAPAETILGFDHRCMQELKQLHTQEETARWMSRVLNQFVDQVFDQSDTKHKNVIREAVSYMDANCARALTLAEAAEHVGYSPSHFSKVFKDEMGCGFRAYLNRLRVERSKTLLLRGNLSIAEICERCGFDDQSYHCKVFKKLVGVTPDRYRKQSRRIDGQREYGEI